MKTQPHKSRYLPLLAVGMAVILFSTAGIAAIKGWLPAPTVNLGNTVPFENSAVKPVKTSALPAKATKRLAEARARTNGRCVDCGIVVSMLEINGHDDDSGIGVESGLLAGDQDEKSLNSAKGYKIIVRMTDGSIQAITHLHPANWRPGTRVIIIDGAIPSRR